MQHRSAFLISTGWDCGSSRRSRSIFSALVVPMSMSRWTNSMSQGLRPDTKINSVCVHMYAMHIRDWKVGDSLARAIWDPVRSTRDPEYAHEVFLERVGLAEEHEVIALFDSRTFNSNQMRIFPGSTVLLAPGATIKPSMAAQAYYRKQVMSSTEEGGPGTSGTVC